MRLYSQNVDGIDTSLPPLATTVPLNKKGPWPKTIQLHGGLEKMVCSKCGHLSDFEGALFEGPEPPSCTECETTDTVRTAIGLRSHGIGRLRPRMVLYNEFNPDEEAIGAVSAADLRSRPDAVIVVGTSLKVPGIRRLAKELCAVTRGRRGGFTAWINHDPEPVGIDFKDSWDMVVRGECDDVAREIGLPNWDDRDTGDFKIVTSDEDKAKKASISVELKPLPLDVVKTQVPTPGASPQPQSVSHVSGVIKSKQSKLLFGVKDTATKGNPKKVYRKPKAAEPKNRITNAFNTSKVSKSTVTSEKAENRLSDLFPGLSSSPSATENSGAMRHVSPTDHRTNTDLCSSYKKEDEPFSSSAPSTPIQEIKPFDRQQTISPKGRCALPSGMENLIS